PWLPLLLLAALSGCGDDAPATPDAGGGGGGDGGVDAGESLYRAECENLNPMHCLLPWPSSRYLADDASSVTGHRVALPVEAMPTNRRRVPIDPEQFNRFDGFSPATSIITSFEGQLDESKLSDEDHIADTLGEDATTVLIDAETLER